MTGKDKQHFRGGQHEDLGPFSQGSEDGEASPWDVGMGGEILMAPDGEPGLRLDFLCFYVPQGPGQDAKEQKVITLHF